MMNTDKSLKEIIKKEHRQKVSLLLAVLLSFVILVMSPVTIYANSAKAQDTLEIILTQNKAGMLANGTLLSCQKPFVSGKAFYLPAKAVLEAFGADVETASDGTVTVTYKENAAKIKASSSSFTLNGQKKLMPVPPVISGSTLMIPLEFIRQCFDIETTFDAKTGKAVLLQKDDGSLADLSFLTGSITTQKAGNSYFGWSIALPKGSAIASKSFNSKNVQFENEYYGFDLDINAGSTQGKTLKQYYDQIETDPASMLDAEPLDSSLNLSANPQYIELLYNNSYDEAVYERIFVKEASYIDVIVTSYDEIDPAKLKNDKTVIAMMNSFSLGYKGNLPDTADLSSVNNGLAKYSSFVTSEATGKKLLSWEMNILPEWNLKDNSASTPFNTEFDGDPGEYVRVEMEPAKGIADIDAKGKSLVGSYTKNFNPQYFSLEASGTAQYAGIQCYELKFLVKMGKKQYRYDERLILKNDIVYDITFKSPAEAFQTGLLSFNRMFATLKTSPKDEDKILEQLQKNEFNLTRNSVGKEDALTIYENKPFKWKLTLPGYWQKNGTSGQSLESFIDNNSGALISVEVSALKEGEPVKDDRERFRSMKLSGNMADKPVKTGTELIKDRNVTIYQFRIDDADSETYADLYYYVFDKGGSRYCFMSTIPDLTASEYNLNSLKSIWESFEILE